MFVFVYTNIVNITEIGILLKKITNLFDYISITVIFVVY